VAHPLKRETAWKLKGLIVLFLFPLFAMGAENISLDQLNDCNWLVNYRGRTYDLAPLTREALARPIETDIRYALQRVPEANAHLTSMSGHLRDARAHTIFASVFLSGFILSRVLRSSQKNRDSRAEFDISSAATGAFFLGATMFSWKSTRAAKHELVSAVAAFNESSPYKIEPAMGSQTPVAQ
jgi:hypothetical protein